MANETPTEPAKNSDSAPAPATVEVKPDDTPQTPATDTRPPEEKDATTAAPEPTQNSAPAAEAKTSAKPAHKAPAKKAAAKKSAPAKTEEPKAATEKPKATPRKTTHEWSYEQPDPSIVTRIQRALGRHGYYYGPADGKFETKSIQGVQRAIVEVGYEGTPTGHIGEEQAKLVQKFAKRFGTYTGPINGKVNDQVWAGFAVALERRP